MLQLTLALLAPTAILAHTMGSYPFSIYTPFAKPCRATDPLTERKILSAGPAVRVRAPMGTATRGRDQAPIRTKPRRFVPPPSAAPAPTTAKPTKTTDAASSTYSSAHVESFRVVKAPMGAKRTVIRAGPASPAPFPVDAIPATKPKTRSAARAPMGHSTRKVYSARVPPPSAAPMGSSIFNAYEMLQTPVPIEGIVWFPAEPTAVAETHAASPAPMGYSASRARVSPPSSAPMGYSGYKRTAPKQEVEMQMPQIDGVTWFTPDPLAKPQANPPSAAPGPMGTSSYSVVRDEAPERVKVVKSSLKKVRSLVKEAPMDSAMKAPVLVAGTN